MALDDAGMKLDDALCASMDMIVAAGGGERDTNVDTQILTEALKRNDRDLLLNEKFTTELRPTLFLAQLSNLLAGNISIVHKVTGSSRTFMGEESSGVAALQTAAARIRAGSADHVLIGASYNAEHPDMLLGYELGGYLHRGGWAPLARRSESGAGGGVVTGSGGVFLVLESAEHAARRGRAAYACVQSVVSDRAQRGSARDSLAKSIESMLQQMPLNDSTLCISGASGALAATAAERETLSARNMPALAFANMTGHMREAHFLFAVALAALTLHRGGAPLAAEKLTHGDLPSVFETALATGIGFHRGEGIALLAKA
jgi:3-oxoacyl-[acyl-carrier-protein] synthase II